MKNNLNFKKRTHSKRKDSFPVKVEGLAVDVSKHKSFDSAMNKWLRKVQEDGKMDQIRERRYYEKPTQKRRRKASIAKFKEKVRRQKERENSQ